MPLLRKLALLAFLGYLTAVLFTSLRQPIASAYAAALAQSTGTPAAAPTTVVHVVARGDVLWRIAEQYGVTAESIVEANGLPNTSGLQVGQMLIIPMAMATTPTPTSVPPTYTPSPTPTPTATPDPAATPVNYPTAIDGYPTAQTLLPTAPYTPPLEVNGIPLDQFIVMPPDVVEHSRAIFAVGQALGNRANAFSKMGDSTIESPFFMDRFDQPGGYNLGDYAYLQSAINQFQGSFSRDSVAVRVGLHSWSIFDPMWGDARCNSGESVIECEIRLNRPAILFVRLGSNDAGVPEYFERNLRQIIEYCAEHGVIPIIGTKADRFEGGNINNDILRRLAAEYAVPLWDFDLLAGTIPGRGLVSDGVHMNTFYAHDWTQPQGLQTGHGVHSLTGLMMLDAVWREVMGGS